jgi:hypothetical protein
MESTGRARPTKGAKGLYMIFSYDCPGELHLFLSFVFGFMACIHQTLRGSHSQTKSVAG